MGLFTSKNICSICNNPKTTKCWNLAAGELICEDCYKQCNFANPRLKNCLTVSEVKTNLSWASEQHIQELKSFTPTKVIDNYLKLDDINKKLLCEDYLTPQIHKYEDILSYELIQDGESVTSGGLVGGVLGGVLFGGAGAVAGSVVAPKKTKSICNSMQIKITLNNINNPTVYINIFTHPIRTSTPMYKTAYKHAQECLSVLELICHTNQQKQDKPHLSNIDELVKFKELLDNGVITETEFNLKKAQLLNL